MLINVVINVCVLHKIAHGMQNIADVLHNIADRGIPLNMGYTRSWKSKAKLNPASQI
jgi:hypothetical protein